MENHYQLSGEWDEKSTLLLMKAMFCREVNYTVISDESIGFLKEWASMASPFNQLDFNKIFDDYRKEFFADPVKYITHFFYEIKKIQWPNRNIEIFMSLILNEPARNVFQVALIKLIRHYIGDKCDTLPEYEKVRRIPIDRSVISHFLESGIISYSADERILLLLEFEHKREKQEDIFDFPDVYVSEEFLRSEEQGEILILINPNISTVLKSVTLKYDEINSFQDILDILYNYLLINKVDRYSYGIEWILSKYNGIDFTFINKLQNPDTRSLEQIGIIKNDIIKLEKPRDKVLFR
jgi:hypothetical protein